MSSSSSGIGGSQWLQVALIASAASAVSSYIVLQLSKRDEDSRRRQDEMALRYGIQQQLHSHKHLADDDSDSFHHVRGWSMAEAMEQAKEDSARAKAKSPSDVFKSLQKGNSRFWTGRATRPEVSAFERRALINSQFPSTAILGCSDSRVPVEIVFDQGLGDMFVIRVAGNCLGPTTEASLEYAVNHLNVKVLLVMGHECCGAVKAARLPVEKIEQETESLAGVLKGLKNGLNETQLCQITDPRARDREAVVSNVRSQVLKLVEKEAVMAKIDRGELILVGAFYEMSSGIVDFFMQVSQQKGKEFKPASGVQSRYNPKTKEVVYA